ncbi:MAG: hypothetical protein RLY70_4645, partial [Planctomycetota bacterium]
DTVNAGGGDDTLVYPSPSDAIGDVVDGGTGTNTILFTSTTAGETLVIPATITNFPTVKIADASGATTGTTALSVDTSAISTGMSLIGNDGANSLKGGAGNDTLIGNGGDDTLEAGAGTNAIDGGAGTDTAVFPGNYTAYTLAFSGANVVVTRTSGGSSVDTVTNVERFQFADKSVLVVGSAVGSAYTTIQSAVTAASAGDIVMVLAGTFAETVAIDKSLTLSGPNAAVAGSGTRNAEATISGGVVVNGSSATNVTITGFSVTGSNVPGSSGLLFGNTGAVAGPVNVTNNIIGNWTTGISLGGGATFDFSATGNTFSSTNTAYIAADGTGLMPAFATLYANNTFANTVEVSPTAAGANTSAIYSTVAAGISAAANNAAVKINAGTYSDGAVTVNANGLTVNAVSGASGFSFTLGTASDLTLTGAAVVDITGNANDNSLAGNDAVNTITPLGGTDTINAGGGNDTLVYQSPSDATGDVVDGGTGSNTILFTSSTAGQTFAVPATFTNIQTVKIADASGATTGTTALSLDGSTISGGSTLVGNDGANSLKGGAGNDTLTGNGGDDTLEAGAGTNTIDGGAGVDTAIFAGSATNYTLVFGVSSVTVTSNAGFSPASVNTLTNTEILKFAGDSGSLLVVGPNSAFTTIQSAVDAATAGDTIRVVGGTFVGNVTIAKSLVIQGANAGVAGATSGRAAESIIQGFVDVTSAASTVTFNGLRFEPVASASAWGGTSLRSSAATTVLRNSVVVTGAADSYTNSGNAVTSTSVSTTIEDNLFLNSLNPAAEPNLLLVQNEVAGGVAAINRNTFTHTGTTSNVDSIRLAGQFTTAMVGYNTITRGGDAVQILGSNSVGTYATLTVTNNTIVDAGRDGVVVGGTTAATYVNIQAGSIDHNAITGGGTAGTNFAAIRIPSGN